MMNNDISIENKPFNVLVLGQLMSGKSTFVNALLGKISKAVRTAAGILVPSEIEYGTNENQALVYESGSSRPRMLSPERITEELALSLWELEIMETGGRVDRLDRIDRVDRIVFQCSSPMLKNNVRLIEFPDLEHPHLRIRRSCEYIPKASAIVFVLNAPWPFSARERQFIQENFADKGMRNVFFVINRIDQLSDPDALEKNVKPAVRAQLEDVFTDENGRFDEELFNRRVLYITAYGALCARTGEPFTVLVGRKAIPVPIEIEETGILEFEQAFEEYRYRQREGLVRLRRMMQGRRGI